MIRLEELLRKRKKILYHFYDMLEEAFKNIPQLIPPPEREQCSWGQHFII
jgi:hypothetical protein